MSNGFNKDIYGDVEEYKFYPGGKIYCHARIKDFVTINRGILMAIPLFI